MAGELKLLPFLGEGHICMQTAAASCLVRAGLLPSFPLGWLGESGGKLSHGQPPRSKMICWPVSAGQICRSKGRGSKLWGNGVAIGSTASSGQLSDRGRRHPSACRLFPGLRAANGGIRELSGHWEQLLLEGCGKRYAPPKLPLSCACLRFFVNVPEPQKQKKSAQLKALRG